MVAWFDSVILNWFQSIQNEFLTVLFKAITFLGECIYKRAKKQMK